MGESITDRNEWRLGVQEGHSPEEPALHQLSKPREKMMRPRPRTATDTETFTVCSGDSPGAAKTETY